MRRQSTVAITLLFVLGLASCGEATEKRRPNIVLILCDDLGFSDLGCYGGEIRTPNLDRLASEGMQFTQFYNCAVCVTTRAALITGLHPRRRNRRLLHADMTTLAEVLQSAGYRTSLTGKWHLGSTHPNRPTDRGFEEYYGVASGCCNSFNPAKPDPVFYNGGKRRPFLHNGKPVTKFPKDYYTTDAFTDHAVRQIGRFSRAKQPFFVHVCYTAPHFPLHAKPKDIALAEDPPDGIALDHHDRADVVLVQHVHGVCNGAVGRRRDHAVTLGVEDVLNPHGYLRPGSDGAAGTDPPASGSRKVYPQHKREPQAGKRSVCGRIGPIER